VSSIASQKSRHFKLHWWHGQVCIIALDNAADARSQRKKLSTIFVDNTVDGFCKDKVSGVAKSIFCSAIKKYASRFRICFQTLAFEGRMAARFTGCSHDRFMTIVDEGAPGLRMVNLRKQAESANKIPAKANARKNYAESVPFSGRPARIECRA